MSMQDIAVVDIKTPEAWVDAIVSGDIDAIGDSSTVCELQSKIASGANAVVWSRTEQPTSVYAGDFHR